MNYNQSSTYAAVLIDSLLQVHALANMHKSSGDPEYLKTAQGWLPQIEYTLASLKRELAKQS